uniref:Carbamoyl phosphate synthase small chain n=1 Tax=Polysiphonia scopulorum TaxID=257860 RepID=A0A1Z1MHK7_9FLOR|nr:carbamoyl phosphate synthase small subunit [Polysiphonia scopulorum]ARW65503.1 carbamoyl phosphate synthase small subunit [Polysiphonia scopulorum]
MSNSLYPSVLYLQDGTFYKGWSFFELSSSFGELVFNTGMTGYQEIFSDPSYSGQMVIFTYPEIGNTGLNNNDNESDLIHIKGIVAKNISSLSSNWRSKISLKDYIILKKIPHIFGLDTRCLTKHLTTSGVMNAFLSNFNNDLFIDQLSFKNLDTVDLSRKITRKKHYQISSKTSNYKSLFASFAFNKISRVSYNPSNYKIVVIDFGAKFNILRILLSLNSDVFIVPSTSSYKTVLSYKPDAVLLSNGPGNPMMSFYSVTLVKDLINFANVPIFGICMGHQILNLALGCETFKLKFGHRGLNHPSGCNYYSEMTSQNHGFAVNTNSLFNKKSLGSVNVPYLNLNDSTVSVTCHRTLPIFSVQYHPEASPGPHDSQYLFKIFINLIDKIQKAE